MGSIFAFEMAKGLESVMALDMNQTTIRPRAVVDVRGRFDTPAVGKLGWPVPHPPTNGGREAENVSPSDILKHEVKWPVCLSFKAVSHGNQMRVPGEKRRTSKVK